MSESLLLWPWNRVEEDGWREEEEGGRRRRRVWEGEEVRQGVEWGKRQGEERGCSGELRSFKLVEWHASIRCPWDVFNWLFAFSCRPMIAPSCYLLTACARFCFNVEAETLLPAAPMLSFLYHSLPPSLAPTPPPSLPAEAAEAREPAGGLLLLLRPAGDGPAAGGADD